MRKIKSLMPIILLSILLIAGTASAATLTPVGTRTADSTMNVVLSVDEVTGIDAFDVTVTGTGLTTTTTADQAKVGSIAASWLLYNVSTVTDGLRILAAGGTGSGSTGAGNLGTITFTATDGCAGDTETVTVTVNSVTPGIALTPAAFTQLDSCTGCTVWDDVITKYNAYIGPPVTATWADVIACYTAYVGTR